MEALLSKADNISTIEEAEVLLYSYTDFNSKIIRDALHLSKKAHEGQTRRSGEPYVIHPIIVASITALISADDAMVAAALMHDVVEDTNYTIQELSELFGEDVAFLVEGVTKIEDIRDEELIPSSSNQRLISSALTFRKMLLSSIKDVRILVVKLCDRLHNMTTLDALSPEKQLRISKETMVVYAPIAHRLGISQLKNRLEDLSFYYIYPHAYGDIDTYIVGNSQNLQLKLNTFVQKIEELMMLNGFKSDEFEVFGRVKHYYSMYQKMQRKGIGIDEILDLIAIRILIKEDIDCYRVLGLLHINFKPIISRFKDYITLPKENGYSTIHTTLFDDDGIVEAQIRTFEMHEVAEFGIAAHWQYKEGGRDKKTVNLEWLESLQYQNDNVEEFYALAKGDLFSDDISVFSPAGDHYTLPRDSVALDFAYGVHSHIGNTAVRALVNKEKSSLLTTLKNGDIVRIITDDDANVHCSWLDTVRTSKAKEGIKSACKQRIKACDKLSSINIFSLLLNIPADEIESLFNISEQQDNAFKLTSNRQIYKDVLDRFMSSYAQLSDDFVYPKEFTQEHFKFISNKEIESIEFDYCCHPKIGDQIIAFYQHGKVIIHHKLCQQAYRLMEENTPMIFVTWVNNKSSRYQLIISLQNRKGILAELLHKLAVLDLNVLSIALGIRSSETAEFCKIEVESKEQNSKKLKDKLSKKFKLVDMISLNDAYNNK
ncbi:MAG TPA: bifunctional (p)ppGpp synthetase/guanosine-3',5'-bis(diphosphate) 3'-pyrophosphohydrolase [Campylobacterales bacterium]|nr:bifunctional (p)ppGpp synthetase/guanosine-3',5'-bis(diphosphate) 3'-pyrophosphohydrolase [Campylobacterales bacterium]HIP41191.1 bifunctional (p)ppGpp synthetase/guanosine-3',5'-bis(diphosphate) 3'-pyrophosphohydrolase [Campylobacterales bacterium]